jgi:hypothetical protein
LPWIIDYPAVQEQMREQKFKSLYYNSGAFGFPPDVTTHIRGWIGADDPTLRESARSFTRRVPEPYVENLVSNLTRIWQEHLPGRAWVMPMSHWSYELDFGSRDWLPAVLEHIQLDPGLLINRNNGSAIEFAVDEVKPFALLVTRLLEMLQASDFAIFFPKHPLLVTLHHHKQLWWVSGEQALIDKLDAIVR